jgi:E3 ubiquitin-protein ligase synoviolin
VAPLPNLVARAAQIEAEAQTSVRWYDYARLVTLLALLFVVDICFIVGTGCHTVRRGPSVLLLFGFEYVILFTHAINTFLKFVLYVVEVRSGRPWESR